MTFPEYFSRVPAITVHDPLAEILGTAKDGLIEYRFADAVRLTGHACPTVASAWLILAGALRALYPSARPERGNLEVSLPDREEEGVSGVIASLFTLVTGAAGSGGFKGLAGRFERRQQLHFGVAGVDYIRVQRKDNGLAVDCHLDLSIIPADPRCGSLLGRRLAGHASSAEQALFTELWQERVRRILLDTEAHERMLSFRLSSASGTS